MEFKSPKKMCNPNLNDVKNNINVKIVYLFILSLLHGS